MQLPPAAWITVAVIALVLCALTALTVYAILRRATRVRLSKVPALWMLALIVTAAMPWLVVRVAPINIELNVHGKLQLAGWLLVALVAFALLVLLPIAATLTAVVWLTAWRRRRNAVSRS